LRENAKAGERIAIMDHYSRGCLAYYLEPEAGYVFMKPGWEDGMNRPENRIWLVDEDGKDLTDAGWLVLPPTNFAGLDRERFKQLARGREPVASYKTQGKGHPLEIYRLE